MRNNETVAATLREALGFVGRGWTQGASARTTSGAADWPRSPMAVCWCADGAICATGCSLPEQFAALAALGRVTDSYSIIYWNDTPGRTQADVIDAFERAIAAQ